MDLPVRVTIARQVTVLIPTRNEAANVLPLLDRLVPALQGLDAEVLFVDDSDDSTPEQVRRAARVCSLPVRLLHREGAARRGGLGGAVEAGLQASCGRWVVVMDGDLQHPPETIPALLAAGGAARAWPAGAGRRSVAVRPRSRSWSSPAAWAGRPTR